MAEKRPEDEFQFSEADVEDISFEEQAESAGPETRVSRKTILIAIGIILLALLLYRLIGYFFEKGPRKEPAKPAVVQKEPEVEAAVPPSPPQIPSQIQPAQIPSPPSQVPIKPQIPEQPVSHQQISEMQAQHRASTNAIQNLSENVESLATTINNMQTSLTNIDTQLNVMTNQLSRQEVEIRALRVLKVTPQPIEPVIRPLWYIHAIIYRRAWLINEDGEIISVAMGAFVPGLGKVTVISVPKGIVKTSSGAIIRFRGS